MFYYTTTAVNMKILYIDGILLYENCGCLPIADGEKAHDDDVQRA